MAAAPTDSPKQALAYAAVYGRNAALSAAELFALGECGGFAVAPLSKYAAGLSEGFELDVANRLGGTTKIIELDPEVAESAEAAIHALAGTVARPTSGKLIFGISSYGSVPATPLTGLMDKLLIKRDIKTRYMAKRSGKAGRASSADELSAVQIKHNKLLTKGADWCLFETPIGWRYGRTVWVYDFEGFGKRDYDKPVADSKRGMLPPQLARVMVNLGTQGRDVPVYDPFCGVGGLLLESVTMGHTTYGSDLEQTAVDGAERNLEWLTGKRPHPGDGQLWKLAMTDATRELLTLPHSIIVTEGYLGEPVQQSTSEADIRQRAAAVEELLERFLKLALTILPGDDRLVITVPIWKLASGRLLLSFVDRLGALGYTIIRPLPENFPVLGVTPRGSIEASRDKQRVIHELFILKKT